MTDATATLRSQRESLYRDARSARASGESIDEWRETLAQSAPLAAAAKALGDREMHAIASMVWRIDRKQMKAGG